VLSVGTIGEAGEEMGIEKPYTGNNSEEVEDREVNQLILYYKRYLRGPP
jgi:hypothetical protein